MDIFKQYDLFKEKCSEFPEKFEKKYFSENKLVCHPKVKNELISLCSDEEAHSNALCICRMGDMLLMSDDNEEWSAFNLMEARAIAEQNGYIYLTDLLGEGAFLSEDWMINGKNDTIIVNEEYMREKGKRYAPVTPLTNKVLHFKKYNNSFFWKSAEPGEIFAVNKEHIEKCYKEFFEDCSAVLPDLSGNKTISFKLFEDEVHVDAHTTKAKTIEAFFSHINSIVGIFAENSEVLEMVGYEFSDLDFILDLTAAALRKNGIELSKEEFKSKYYSAAVSGGSEKLAALSGRCGNDDIDFAKLAFIDAVTAEYEEKISYTAEDFGFYENKIRQLEQGSYTVDEEKYLIKELLSKSPSDYRIFYYTFRKYPEEAENLEAIREFWEIDTVSEEDMENVILGTYILDESFDEQGRFCAGYDESCILKEQLEKVIEAYGIANRECIEELDQHIDMLDKERRTFNGMLFDTPEEMKLAVKNEAYIQELCTDLSALNEEELKDLEEHIDNTTLDDNTKSKYKLKVKLAMNNVQTSMLEQKCLKLPVMSFDEIASLKDKIVDEDYPEAVIKPFIAKIRDAFISAQKNEIDAMLDSSDSLTDEQLNGIFGRITTSGRYESAIVDFYRNKIVEIKENNVRTRLHKLTDGFENFGKEKLIGLIEILSGDDFPKHMTYGILKKVNTAIENYEINEAAKAFEGVEFATAEQLEDMKEIIAEKFFSDEILAPYIIKVEQRAKELINEELADMCADIDNMSQEQLDELKEKITTSDKGFDEALVNKYLDKITQRGCELTNSELAELCKYIFSMEQPELDELKIKLADEKYDKEFTAVYYRKIDEREQELTLLELDKLCENIGDMDIPALEDLKGKILDEEKYDSICDKYIVAINEQIDRIKIADYRKIIDSAAEMNAEEIAEFRKTTEEKRNEIGEELYKQSIEAADAREDILETEELEELCAGIEDYDLEKAESVKSTLAEGGYTLEKANGYIAKINERIIEIHTANLDAIINGIGDMDKERLIQAQINVQNYGKGCPEELKSKYIASLESAASDIAEKEIKELCGNVSSLSVKKSQDIIRKLNTMPIDEDIKNRYVDVIDAHIASIKDNEAKDYIRYLSMKMDDMGVNSVHLSVPGLSNLFFNKYEAVSKAYISAGRYELPILLHEGSGGDGFTMTTEYLYTYTRGVLNRIKIDDIASFQAKKGLMSSSLIATEKNGNNNDLPNALNKNVIENVAKVLTALVCYINDKRSAEHMKELLENAVQQEKAIHAEPVVIPEPVHVPEHALETEPVPAPVVEEAAPVSEPEPVENVPETTAEEISENPAEEEFKEAPPVENVPVEDAPAEEAPKAEVKIRFCDQCGAKIPNPNAKFCMECGNKLQQQG